MLPIICCVREMLPVYVACRRYMLPVRDVLLMRYNVLSVRYNVLSAADMLPVYDSMLPVRDKMCCLCEIIYLYVICGGYLNGLSYLLLQRMMTCSY